MLYFFTKKYSPARLELFLLLPDKRCVIANSEKASARSSFAKRSWPADPVCILLLISVCLAIGLPRYRVGIDWADEGFLAYGAVRVMEGQVPNRDFVSLQPPLSFYAVAAAFKLFGTSLASLRLLGLSIYVLIPLLIYAIARSFMNAAFRPWQHCPRRYSEFPILVLCRLRCGRESSSRLPRSLFTFRR